jgi:hypothetical protein
VNSFSSNSLPAAPTLSRSSVHANSRETASASTGSEDREVALAGVLDQLLIPGHQLSPHPSRRRHDDRGATVNPGVASASFTHSSHDGFRRIRPFASSIPSSQTEIAETRRLPLAAAWRMAVSIRSVKWLASPNCIQIQ